MSSMSIYPLSKTVKYLKENMQPENYKFPFSTSFYYYNLDALMVDCIHYFITWFGWPSSFSVDC